jgi:hypothetical protein
LRPKPKRATSDPKKSPSKNSLDATLQANPLQERAPELYKRLDELSRLPLEKNKEVWDEFCIEIGAGDLYEHLPILVAILREGKWRTGVTHHKAWLRENLARRAKRFNQAVLDDYDATGKRLPCGPKFDKRNGALIEFGTRPFVEFEVQNSDGTVMSPEDVVDGLIEPSLSDDGHFIPMAADADDLRLLGGRTLAERYEAENCKFMVTMLKHERPTFDKALTKAISGLQWLAKRFRLDCDETEVLAVMSLLWDAGPRMYLNQVDEANKKRLRNGWDRLDRKLKDPQFRALFHRTLRKTSDSKFI